MSTPPETLREAQSAAIHVGAASTDTGVGRIAPGRTEAHRAAAAALRDAGLWGALCRSSLWQGPGTGARAVHDESSALAGILNHTGLQESRAAALARRMLEAVGTDTLAQSLQDAGPHHILHEAWQYWARVLHLPKPAADTPPDAFADGWVARLGAPPALADGELPQGCVPETFPDENIGWGVCRHSDDVYPLPF